MNKNNFNLLIIIFTLNQFINCKTIEPNNVINNSYPKIGNYKLISAAQGDTSIVFPDSLQLLMGIIVDSSEITIFDGTVNSHRGCYSMRSFPFLDQRTDTLTFKPSGHWYRSGSIFFKNDTISFLFDDTAGPAIYCFIKCLENIPPASWPDSLCDM